MRPRPANGQYNLAIDLEPLIERIVARLQQVASIEVPPPPKRAFRIPEVAELLSLSVREIERLVADGDLESIKVGRTRLITPQAIDDFITHKLAEAGDNRGDS
jgi:excisionase family DNA binding protein